MSNGQAHVYLHTCISFLKKRGGITYLFSMILWTISSVVRPLSLSTVRKIPLFFGSCVRNKRRDVFNKGTLLFVKVMYSLLLCNVFRIKVGCVIKLHSVQHCTCVKLASYVIRILKLFELIVRTCHKIKLFAQDHFEKWTIKIVGVGLMSASHSHQRN